MKMLEVTSESVDPILRFYVERLDDHWSGDQIDGLTPYLPRLDDTKHDGRSPARKRIIELAAVELAAGWVRAAGLRAEADTLERLTDQLTPEVASPAVTRNDARAALEASHAAETAARALHQEWIAGLTSSALGRLTAAGLNPDVAADAANDLVGAINSAKNAVLTPPLGAAEAAAVAAGAYHAAAYAAMIWVEHGTNPQALVETAITTVKEAGIDWGDLEAVRGAVYQQLLNDRTIQLPPDGVALGNAQNGSALDLLTRLINANPDASTN